MQGVDVSPSERCAVPPEAEGCLALRSGSPITEYRLYLDYQDAAHRQYFVIRPAQRET
jgi:hypothetical protein